MAERSERFRISYTTARRDIKRRVNAHMSEIASAVTLPSTTVSDLQCNFRSDLFNATEARLEYPDGLHVDGDIVQDPECYDLDGIDISDENNSVNEPVDEEYEYSYSVSSSSDGSDDDLDKMEDNLRDSLVNWALQYGINLDAVGGLLQILKPLHPTLPKSARTLLSTPRKVNVKTLSDNGSYYHFGLGNCIMEHVDQNNLSMAGEAHVISVQINIDGVPLFKCNNSAFWPILGIILESHNREPFVIGIYSGSHKPSSLEEYLEDFVSEMLHLERDGIYIIGRHCSVRIHSFVCDAPARAFVKNVKMYSGYYGCDRCCQRGKWENKVTFPQTDAPLRTDVQFKEMTEDEHHLRVSPLARLSVGLVSQFVLDSMHLVFLGVTRRLLLTWMRGDLMNRLPARLVLQISERLLNLRKHIPCEFARKCRPLSEIDRWKATELRQFVLYTGPVVLDGILSADLYQNFLLFSVAVYCLSSLELHKTHCDYAQTLLLSFVNHSRDLYGSGFMVYNVHALIHLADDVRNFGPLDRISSFPFENSLRKIKKYLRKGQLPLQQLVKRITEIKNRSTITQRIFSSTSCRRAHSNGPVVSMYETASQFSVYDVGSFTLKLSRADNCFMSKTGEICTAKNFLNFTSNILIVFSKFTRIQNYYNYPVDSMKIDVFLVSQLEDTLSICNSDQIKCKCVCLPHNNENKYIVVPLLHC